MGLAGRKKKQRIPNDPRNLSWADDAARFGQSYMSKLGWDPTKGLGASGEGMKSHIKVSQKLDMLGIGAAHQQDPHGIAWKQNKDFEGLLKRLNAQDSQDSTSSPVLGEFVRPDQPAVDAYTDREIHEEDKILNQLSKKERKRNRKEGEDDEHIKDTKKQKKEKRKHEGAQDSAAANPSKPTLPDIDSSAPTSSSPDTPSSTPNTMPKGRPMAHRARIQASKRLANKSAAAISEILGIAPTPSSILSVNSSRSLTTITPEDSDLPLEKLTTSNKSVADYFKEKLGAKSRSNTPLTNNRGSTSRHGIDSFTTPSQDDIDYTRTGLGAGRKSKVEGDAVRSHAGISDLSNVFAQFFATSSSSHATVIKMASSATQAIIQPPETTATSYKDESREEGKRKQGRKAPEDDAQVENKKLKVESQKCQRHGTVLPESDMKMIEGPEEGWESERLKRKEDKKKKKKAKFESEEPFVDENLVKSECNSGRRSKKSKNWT